MNNCAILLAAGEGTRMKVPGAKVLLTVLGKPMIEWVRSAVSCAGVPDVCLIVGKDHEQVRAAVGDEVCYALQNERLGTGHAVMQAETFLEQHRGGHCLIAAGDSPLISAATIRQAHDLHKGQGNAVTVVSATVEHPFGYGRILRDAQGALLGIVEEREAGMEQRGICEINSSVYWFAVDDLLSALPQINPNNEKGEYYLTDAIGILLAAGKKAGVYRTSDSQEILGANTQRQLLELHRVATGSILARHMENGVILTSDHGLAVGPDVTIGPGTMLHKGCQLLGKTAIGALCAIGPDAVITDAVIGDQVTVVSSTITSSTVGSGTRVGPYAHIRPDCSVGERVKIGNFVELKNSVIGDTTRIAHLTYIGDSDFGSGINVGCGVVTTNYDGIRKHRTTVEDNAFIGCNVNLIAPVTVGEGAYIAAGSTITDHVPASSLAVARARQVIKENWVLKSKEED